MPAADQAIIESIAPADAARPPLFQLSRQLAHDFSNLWTHIFWLTQQARETKDLQGREDVLDRLNKGSSIGVLYSRNIMESLANSHAAPQVSDACTAVREWATESETLLQGTLAFSCLIPPYPLYIRLPPGALRLILLSLASYALRSGEGKRWAMLGVRSARGEARAKDAADGADIIFLCQPGDAYTSMSYSLQQRVKAIGATVAPYGGTVQSRALKNVGINVHIHLPLVPSPGSVG